MVFLDMVGFSNRSNFCRGGCPFSPQCQLYQQQQQQPLQTSPQPPSTVQPQQPTQIQSSTLPSVTNHSQYPYQLQQPQLQNQSSSSLTNAAQYSCLNHVLLDSVVKAGTTPNLTLHNNTKGVAPGLNQTFIQNATNTLDSCIIPMKK